MKAKLTNTKWTVIGKCSAHTSLRDSSALLAPGVLRRLEGGGRSTGYFLVEEGYGPADWVRVAINTAAKTYSNPFPPPYALLGLQISGRVANNFFMKV